MKIRITRSLFFILSFFACNFIYAQLDFVGSSDYGRIFNITYDPQTENKLYATSLNNHILISEDNGENWEVLFSMSFSEVTEFQNLKMTNNNSALSFIKYNLDSPDNTILIYDLSSNLIINEIQIPGISNVKNIQSYAIHPQDSNIILMNASLDYGNEEYVYYTTDAGQNWEVVYSKNDYDGVSLNNIAINPENPQQLLLTRSFGPNGVEGGLLISNDAGQTWDVQMEGIILNPIAFNPFNPEEIYIGTGMSFGSTPENLYRSTDSGETWEVIPLAWTEGNLDNINYIAFNPIVEGHIIILEENEIVISTDNGVSWENYVYDMDDVHTYYSGWNFSFNPFNENEVYINSDYFPLFSQDGGETTLWKKNNYFRSTGSLGFFRGIEEHLYYGVQYGYVHRSLSTQEEDNFDLVPLSAYSQGDAPSLFVDKTMEGRLFIFSGGWMGANLKVSFDHGQTKHQIHNTYFNYVDALATNPAASNEIWYSLSNNMGDVEFWKADMSDLNNITTTSLIIPEANAIKAIQFDANVTGKVIIANGTNIYNTEDNGISWNLSSSGLEELISGEDLILDLSSNPLNEEELSIATNKGIFSSRNGGATWAKRYDNLVHKTYYSTLTDGHVVAFVFDTEISSFSIIYSIDAGETWTEIDNAEFYISAATDAIVRFEEESAEVYIGSIDLGLMKYTIDLRALGMDSNMSINNSLIMYPNPVKNTLSLKSGDNIESIAVYSITGQRLVYTNVNNKTTNLDLSTLSKGIYLLQVKDGKGIKTHKIIKE